MTHSLVWRQRRPRCPRCGRVLWVHGARRWRCPSCARTFRLRHRRSGPASLRGLEPATVLRFLAGRHSVRSLQERTHRSYGALHRQLQRGLRRLSRRSGRAPTIPLRPRSCVVVADALWLWIGGERVTIYVILVRPVRSDTATVAVVLPRTEWECEAGWCAALLRLPEPVRRFVRAACVDDHTGLRNAIRELCGTPGAAVPMQWCQFHCLAHLLHRLGKKMVRRDTVTTTVWETARRILDEPRAAARAGLCRYLHHLARRAACPPRARRATHWFLVRVPKATVIFRYPNRCMPATTGSAEITCRKLWALLRRVRPRSVEPLQELCGLFQQLHPTVQCNGKLHRNSGS